MKKLIKILILCGLLCTATTTAQAQSGTTGSLQWSISNGTLTITGTGAMPNYDADAQPWAANRNFITHLVIDNGVTNIGNYAFQNCRNLIKANIPNSVTFIGNYAFYNCISLTEVNIPSSVTTIGGAAFNSCLSLTEVSIPNSVTTIGANAFSSCRALTEINIPVLVTSIGDYPFMGCFSLSAIHVDPDNQNYSYVDGVLFNKDTTTMVQYPCQKQGVYKILNSVTAIEAFAFYGCNGLTEINVDPGNLYFSSEEGVLFNNEKTELIAYPGGKQGEYNIASTVTTIISGAFSGCNGLTEVTIPNSVTTIPSYTFFHCFNLTNITIPNSVTAIGGYAFDSCYGLTKVTIPNSVTTIGQHAFRFCTNLTSVTVHWTNPLTPYINTIAFDDCGTNAVALIVPPSTEEDYASSPVWKDFYIDGKSEPLTGKCGDHLTWSYDIVNCTLTISGTGDMENYSSGNVVPWSNFPFKIRTLDLPDGMNSIGNYAFSSCQALIEVSIPNSVTTIGEWAFSESYHILNISSGLTKVRIPNSLTTIGEAAFRYCDKLTAVNIPNSVTTIGDWAFLSCGSLTEVIVSNSVTSIGNYAFFNCRSLADITNHADVPQHIDANVFQNVDISNITLRVPAGSVDAYLAAPVWEDFGAIVAIDYGATCETSMDRGDVTPTMTWILCEDGTLTINGTGDMPDFSLLGVPWHGVRTSISTVKIGEGVTAISDGAFAEYANLKIAYISASVTSIGDGAFADCGTDDEPLYIVGVPGSAAQDFANANAALHIVFVNASALNLSAAEIDVLENPSFVYTGSAHTPAIEVVLGGIRFDARHFAVKYAGNINAGAASITVTPRTKTPFLGEATAGFVIAKAPPPVTFPASATLTYGETLADAVLTEHSGAGTFAFANPTFAPAVAQSGTKYAMIFTPSDTDNYNTVMHDVDITVNKAPPPVTFPAGATLIYGETLADAVLTGHSGAGTFAFANPTFAPSVAQSGTKYAMIFTPSDTDNYNTVIDDVDITVHRATFSGSVTISNTTPKTGDVLTAIVDETTTAGSYTYQWDGAGFATGQTYTVLSADNGKTLRVTVGTANPNYTGTLTSALTQPVGIPIITTAELPDGKIGVAYSETLAADSELPVTSWIAIGNLPEGLTVAGLTVFTGIISGTPAKAGTFYFTVMATNDNGTGYREMSIIIDKVIGAALESRPTPQSVTHNSITVNIISPPANGQPVEYAIRERINRPPDTDWQPGRMFSGLKSDELYYVFARAAENDNYFAGVVSVSDAIMTDIATGNGDIPQTNPLKAWVHEGRLHVSGLVAGAVWSVYSVSGALAYSSVASGEETIIDLPAPGVYIIQSDKNKAKLTINN